MPNGAREHQAAIVAHGPFIPCALLAFEEELEVVVQVVVAMLDQVDHLRLFKDQLALGVAEDRCHHHRNTFSCSR